MAGENISRLLDLQDHGVLVTGGGKGIGQAITMRLAEAGAAVVVVDRDADAASATTRAIESRGGRALAIEADVSHKRDVEGVLESAWAAFGGADILVNNAGVYPFSPVLQTPEDLWDKVLAINLKSVFLCSQAFAKRLVQNGRGGRIVNIASIDAFHPSGSLAHYDASKAGVVMLTKSLAKEFAPLGIQVNAIAPGAVETPGVEEIAEAMRAQGLAEENITQAFVARILLGRMAEPDEIARAVLFFATSLSSYATGSVLVLDGGFLLS